MNSVVIVSVFVMMCCLQSQVDSCISGQTLPCRSRFYCHCTDGSTRKFVCFSGRWILECGTATTTPAPVKTCSKLELAVRIFGSLEFSKNPTEDGRYPVGTTATYYCDEEDGSHTRVCSADGSWVGKKVVCSCPALTVPLYQDISYSADPIGVVPHYSLGTKATYYCMRGDGTKYIVAEFTCTSLHEWKGNSRPSSSPCLPGIATIATTIPTPDITTTTPAPVKTCSKLKLAVRVFGSLVFSKNPTEDGRYPVGTTVTYYCDEEDGSHTRVCSADGSWVGKKVVCSCPALTTVQHQYIRYNADPNGFVPHYPLGTIATYYCIRGSGAKHMVAQFTCTSLHEWKGNSRPSYSSCLPENPILRHYSQVKTTTSPKSTKSGVHPNEKRTLVIVSATTGSILGALIILIAIVSCQRRLHFHRMRRARLRHRQDQDAFTAFITYHRDVRMMLPSYDEAINQEEHGQPPSFEEALRHYEEPTLPPDHPSANENPPSIYESPTSASVSINHQAAETASDPVPLFDAQPSASSSENGRLLRSLRALFGGRSFRPDAIYCRFVPQEDEPSDLDESSVLRTESSASRQESGRNGERENSPEVDELSAVLARAGLC